MIIQSRFLMQRTVCYLHGGILHRNIYILQEPMTDQQQKRNILIAGYYGFGNTGDETILTAMLADLRKQRQDLDYTVISGDPGSTSIKYRVKSILWTDTVGILDAVQNCDLIIVGGGGIFHDQFGFKEEYLLTKNHAGISYFAGFPVLAAMYQKPVMLYAIGVGPLSSEAGERLTKLSIATSNIVTVRDAESLEWALKAGITEPTLRVTADPAFGLIPDKNRAQRILQTVKFPGREGAPLIAVCPRYWDIKVSLEQWQDALAKALDQFVGHVDGDVLFIPFQNLEATPDVNDVAVAVRIREKMQRKDRGTILNKEYPSEVIAGLIASCDFLIGMRLHSLVFAILGGTPLVGLSYDPKVRNLLARVDMEKYCMALDGLSAENLFETLKSAWVEKEKSAVLLNTALKELREGTEANTLLAIDLLDQQTPATRQSMEGEFLWAFSQKQTQMLAQYEDKVLNLEGRVRILEEQNNIPLQIRRWLFPAGSKRDTAFRILRHEGFVALAKRAYEKILRVFLKPEPMRYESIGRPIIKPSLGKADILCFPVIDWDFRFQRPQQLLSQFAQDGHRVFYLRVKFKNRANDDVDIRLIADNVYEVILPGDEATVIYYHDMREETIQRAFLALSRLNREESWSNVICLVHHPFWTPLIQRMKTEYGYKVVYDCMDDHSGFQVTHPEFAKREDELLLSSDLVVVTSRLLYDRIGKIHKNCVLIPNAGDFDHFNQFPAGYQSTLAGYRKPVIGYYGAIAEWFDIEAIHHAAVKHPEWSFVLIGHTSGADLRRLRKLRNVHLLGEKKYAELPSYLAGFDVCTIPFLRIPLTEATNPVKVFEYLSAGKPVVATALPELLPLQEVVSLYTTPVEFTAKLEQALDNDSVNLLEQRIALARENTWHDRYQTLRSRITHLFGKVSIIVITWNNIEHTRRCVQSILADQTWPNYELIIVDNGSTDETPEYLKQLKNQHANIRVVLNRTNVGFAAANNIGLQQAQDAGYIILLNNDTVVPVGWMARLMRHLRDTEIGMVGPVTNSAGNEARIDVPYQSLDDMHTFARMQMASHDGETFDISMLAMYCVAMRKDVVDEIGPLDENFGIGMFEDDDYARRIRQKGYRIVCAEDVFVHHAGRASFAMLEGDEYRKLFEKNRSLFEAKWGSDWVPHKRSNPRQTLI